MAARRHAGQYDTRVSFHLPTLKELRKSVGLTQREAADAYGLKEEGVKQWQRIEDWSDGKCNSRPVEARLLKFAERYQRALARMPLRPAVTVSPRYFVRMLREGPFTRGRRPNAGKHLLCVDFYGDTEVQNYFAHEVRSEAERRGMRFDLKHCFGDEAAFLACIDPDAALASNCDAVVTSLPPSAAAYPLRELARKVPVVVCGSSITGEGEPDVLLYNVSTPSAPIGRELAERLVGAGLLDNGHPVLVLTHYRHAFLQERFDYLTSALAHHARRFGRSGVGSQVTPLEVRGGDAPEEVDGIKRVLRRLKASESRPAVVVPLFYGATKHVVSGVLQDERWRPRVRVLSTDMANDWIPLMRMARTSWLGTAIVSTSLIARSAVGLADALLVGFRLPEHYSQIQMPHTFVSSEWLTGRGHLRQVGDLEREAFSDLSRRHEAEHPWLDLATAGPGG
jgi:transcriptional regulator with XRE-family HTH domain